MRVCSTNWQLLGRKMPKWSFYNWEKTETIWKIQLNGGGKISPSYKLENRAHLIIYHGNRVTTGLQYCICGKGLTETLTPVQHLPDLWRVMHTAIWYSVLKEFYESMLWNCSCFQRIAVHVPEIHWCWQLWSNEHS